MYRIITAIVACLVIFPAFSQDSLFNAIVSENVKDFSYQDGKFLGEGWDQIIGEVEKAHHLMLGEDHFTNEIPDFIREIAEKSKFENFYIEVDPYTTALLENSFRNMSDEERADFNKAYSMYYSFYALQPEYELLEYFMDSGYKLMGSDQIIMFGEQILFPYLKDKNPNEEVKVHYDSILTRSNAQLEKFFTDPSNPMYFMTPGFSEDLKKLKSMEISEEELEIIEKMEKSVEIYQKMSHSIRVDLIIRQVMDNYEAWKDQRTIFKYGSNHLMRGESLLTVYDIGNVVANITEAYEKKITHIMVTGISGSKGSPFKGFPPTKVDKDKGYYTKFLKPFFPYMEGENWKVFDLRPLRRALNRGKIEVESISLQRVIKGYDMLVIIPELTPAGFE